MYAIWKRGDPSLLACSLACALWLLAAACAGKAPVHVGITQGGLAPCPASPNCVSSDANDPEHRVAPFLILVPPTQAWQAARVAVAALPDTRVIAASASRLHAESTSDIFGFVDDLELQLRPSQRLIAVRSASRLGYGDLGVNRERVEALRRALVETGTIR